VVGRWKKPLLRRSTSDAEEKCQVIRQYGWCKSKEGTDVSSLTDLFVKIMELELYVCLIKE
jgi:hypothetical protein